MRTTLLSSCFTLYCLLELHRTQLVAAGSAVHYAPFDALSAHTLPADSAIGCGAVCMQVLTAVSAVHRRVLGCHVSRTQQQHSTPSLLA
jgi:hypothetical protein